MYVHTYDPKSPNYVMKGRQRMMHSPMIERVAAIAIRKEWTTRDLEKLFSLGYGRQSLMSVQAITGKFDCKVSDTILLEDNF